MNQANSLSILIAVGTAVTLFLAVSIVFFVVYYQKKMLQNNLLQQQLKFDYQKKLLQSTIDSQEKERKRIASELHDGVGAMLSTAKLTLAMIHNGTIPKEEFDEAVTDTKQMIDGTIETVRRISKDLLPASLEQFGLVQSIQELCIILSNPTIKITLEQVGEELDKLDKSSQLLLYRITQELINNAIKHADASNIKVLLDLNSPLTLTVEDNGKGFDIEQTKSDIKKGVGLYNIENRASLLNGKVTFESSLGKGSIVSVVID